MQPNVKAPWPSPSSSRAPAPGYPSEAGYLAAWRQLAEQLGGAFDEAGRSVAGRAIPRVTLGPAAAPSVLLTALMHGNEYIGGLALLAAARALLAAGSVPARLVILPLVNPDAFADNCARLAAGRSAYQRCNGRGVDLNRNFGPLPGGRSLHPLSGSSLRRSPYYRGPRPFSEPESRAVRAVAEAARPRLSLAFHSFGELLLYPFACRREPHPAAPEYRRLGALFAAAQARPYKVMGSHGLYPVVGDLDDWIDDALGARAFTIEVGRPAAGLTSWSRARRLLQPFWWMNPLEVGPAVEPVARGVVALVAGALAAPAEGVDEAPREPGRAALPGALAALQ